MKFKINKTVPFVVKWALTIVISAFILIPLYWIFISSIKPSNELFTTPVMLLFKITKSCFLN